MKSPRFLLSTALLLSLLAASAQADGFIVSGGTSGDGDGALRLAYERDWQRGNLWGASGHWDVSVTAWEIEENSSTLVTLSAAPFLRFDLAQNLYVDLGVGLGLFSDHAFGMRDLGSSLTFENRVGLGVRVAEGHDLQLQARHYSNAGLAKPNDGIEIYTLGYRFEF